ncbi:hypothetical protein VTN31DRAFT_973 [Thermomyces dupontii]|uniref:uncharacterized protein n=1 Tax=Talaromyces thermophilus TaxID=28565 RepID=UPI0037441284
MAKRVTIFDPPPLDTAKAGIENILELTPMQDIGPDVFTNSRPLWHPPGARGVYGGAVIAQCLAAAQRTVPEGFTVHSMHCYFVLAGDSEIPIIYHVERVRDGRSFATRTVQARQRGRPIFTTTLSFNKDDSGGKIKVEHSSQMPSVPPPKDQPPSKASQSPFEVQRIRTEFGSEPIEQRRLVQWCRVRDKISEEGGHRAHLSALAYISDNYFIGTVPRVHKIPRFSSPTVIEKALKALKNPSDLGSDFVANYINEVAPGRQAEIRKLAESHANGTAIDARKISSIIRSEDPREIGMMVSLDHTIYFHNPRAFRADEWMLCVMESPWSGDGRGLVQQKIWSRDGVHIATCVQEGVIRLKQDEPKAESKL